MSGSRQMLCVFNESQKDFITELFPVSSYPEIIEKLNKKFGTAFSYNQVNNFCKTQGLRKPHLIDPAIPDFIRSLMPLHGEKVAALVNEKFGTNYNRKSIKGVMHSYGIKSGLKNTSETSCGKYRPIGTEKLTKIDGGFAWKIKTPDGWQFKHRYLWEQANGPIPPGHYVAFLNHNTMDCSLENLALIPNGVFAVMNRNGYFTNDRELTKTGLLLATHKAAVIAKTKELGDTGKSLLSKHYKDRYKKRKAAAHGR
jgi:hypothetical protein